jgi:hypothetical protein
MTSVPSKKLGHYIRTKIKQNKLLGERNIPTERPPLVGEVSATFSHVVSVTDSYGRILIFLDRNRYFFFQVAPQLYSRGWVNPVPDPLLLRQSGRAGNRTRTSGSVTWNSDHYTTEAVHYIRTLTIFHIFELHATGWTNQKSSRGKGFLHSAHTGYWDPPNLLLSGYQ